MVLLVIIELIPILLGILFIVNIMEEYKQFGLIVTKLSEGEQCMIQQQFKNDEQEATANEICIDENILRERELLVLKRERILDEREEFLKKREEQFNERKMKSVSYTNSSEQYAKKLKTRFR
jgi:hypothetical protein